MATFVAAPLYDPFVDAADHTVDVTYIGQSGTQVVGGFDPGGARLGIETSGTYIGTAGAQVISGLEPESAGTPSWSPSTREGFAAETGSYTTSLEQPYIGQAGTQVIGGLEPGGAGTGVETTETYIGQGGTQLVGGLDPDAGGLGSVIPTSYFRKATGTVRDAAGNLIDNALYIIGLDDFSTLGPVEPDGSFSIFLLRVQYETFILVGDGGDNKAYDLVWYESEPGQVLPPDENEIDLRFETEEPQIGLPSGVNAALDVNFG